MLVRINIENKLKSERLNVKSFQIVYHRYYRPILKYVRNQISTLHLAEEVTQDIFLKIYQNRNSYDSNFVLTTWIWTIARNTVFDYLRKVRSNNSFIFQSLEDLTQTSSFEPSLSETAESILIRETDRERLRQMLVQLSEKQKEAIYMRLVKKLSYREISSTMNLSLSAVKSLINRGKATLISISQVEARKKSEYL